MDDKIIVSKMISLIDKIENYISGMDYDGINVKVVWETVTQDLPRLREQLKAIIN